MQQDEELLTLTLGRDASRHQISVRHRLAMEHFQKEKDGQDPLSPTD